MAEITLTLHAIPGHETEMWLGIHPAATTQVTTLDLVGLGDISGSMGSEVVLKNAEGVEERNGFTRWNMAQHALRTLASSLHGSGDHQFGLVTFETEGHLESRLLPLTAPHLTYLQSKINAIEPGDRTNIWGGLEKALNLFNPESRNLPVILLLSDGYDYENPKGVLPHLQQWHAAHLSACAPLIFTTGFTTYSESLNMVALAKKGHGNYSYIHDAKCIAGVFGNFLANVLVTIGVNLICSIDGVDYALPDIGALLAGQSKYVRLQLGAATATATVITLRYQAVRENFVIKKVTIAVAAATVLAPEELAFQELRHQFVTHISDATLTAEYDITAAMAIVNKFMALANTGPYRGAPKNKALFDDGREAMLAMQDILAVQQTKRNQPYLREDQLSCWGYPYLRSVTELHYQQVKLDRNNAGSEWYTSAFRNEQVTRINDIFNTLPAQKPAKLHQQQRSSLSFAPPPPTNMSAYNLDDDVCLAGWCQVRLYDGTFMRVDEIKKGDRMCNGGVILCVLQTTMQNSRAELVNLPTHYQNAKDFENVLLQGGLFITSYHPIRLDATCPFMFPSAYGLKAYAHHCTAIYSFVMDTHHWMDINGYQCITLAHGNDTDLVAKHPYFGTQRILDELQMLDAEGYAQGLIKLSQGALFRDAETGLIAGFKF